jgi:hypothetical protein
MQGDPGGVVREEQIGCRRAGDESGTRVELPLVLLEAKGKLLESCLFGGRG